MRAHGCVQRQRLVGSVDCCVGIMMKLIAVWTIIMMWMGILLISKDTVIYLSYLPIYLSIDTTVSEGIDFADSKGRVVIITGTS